MTQPPAPAIRMPASTFPAWGVPGLGTWKAQMPMLALTSRLMAFRAIPPPPIVPARLGSDAPLLGAADEAFALLLTDEGLQAWAARQL